MSALIFSPTIEAPSLPQRRVDPREATETARRIVRKAATIRFGRGRSMLVYELGCWWAIVKPPGQQPQGYVAVARTPGVGGTGVDFERKR